ncbi:Lnb N-terminal periplasmic domain-containing protein [Methylomonas lenta]|nr:DUF4105 domain-containing protein [Methylomonas lenta]
MKKLLISIPLALLLITTSVWGTLALYFGDSETGLLQICLASAFGLFSFVALIGLLRSRWRYRWLFGHMAVFMLVLLWWLNISPSNDRDWQADVSKLPFATIDGNKVTMHNIRNFDYRSEFDYTPAYYDKTFDIDKLNGVDLFAFYWMGPAIAHTILSFDFADQGSLAVSIETRKQNNEEYSTIKGFFRQYELIYIVADERDVIRLRTNYRHNPPEDGYLYKGLGSQVNAQRLFLEYVKQINELHDKPTFYNTLLDNCTIAIWFRTMVNNEHLPFSWKILVSGYLPEYLYESKRIEQQKSFAELQQQAHINQRAQAADKSADFSKQIRASSPIEQEPK